MVYMLAMLLLLWAACGTSVWAGAVSDGSNNDIEDYVELLRSRRSKCNPKKCKNGGICNPYGSDPLCICPEPYTGSDCTILINYCTTETETREPIITCKNGGTCSSTEVSPWFHCTCLPGFTGQNCEADIDECAGNPCINGQCTDLVNGYSCSCYSGWEGVNCSINHDDCPVGACLNGGRCLDGNSTYSCNCSDTGFRGANCSENIDDCGPVSPCQHGGSCTDRVKKFTCTCLDGYSGRNCSVDVADCQPNPCHYNGSCLERSRPELYSNSSLPAPFNGAFNFSTAAGFVCLCPPGTFGSHCSINPNDCVIPGTNTSVCVHASGCTDGLDTYNCHCLSGYTDLNCSTEINECELFGQPCRNGAVCRDLVADYACVNCPAGFGGKNCSIRLIGCATNECHNGATCEPILVRELPTPVHDYRCLCKPGWAGSHCNITSLVSFNGSSSFSAVLGNRSSAATIDWIVELSFRTTLTQFDLIAVSSGSGSIRVGAHNSSLVLILLNNASSVIGQAKWPISESLASVDWLTLSISATNGSGTLKSNKSEPQIQLIGGLSNWWNLSEVSVHVGGERGSAIDGGGFRGCVRDMRFVISDSEYVAMETGVESGNASWGVCSRSAQCGPPSPCESATTAMCSDLWNDFVCQCKSDYGGRTCSVPLPSFTFGPNGNVSYASFASLSAGSSIYGGNDLWIIELKLVTMTSNAFLLLFGDPSNSATSPRLLVTIKATGHLSVQLLVGNSTQLAVLTSPAPVTTGVFIPVKFSVSVSQRFLSLQVSSDLVRSSTSFGNESLAQLQGHLIVGGFRGAPAAPAPALSVATTSGGSIRSKRSAPLLPSSISASLTGGNKTAFRGSLSSVRLNADRPLILDADADANLTAALPRALKATDSMEVAPGAKAERVCETHAPCRNGALCTDVFYNSYVCNCTEGWRGSNCQEVDHCYPGAGYCPNGTECVNLDPRGFECRTAATFGSSRQTPPISQLQLTVSKLNESLATVSGWARTRQSNCRLLSVVTSGVGGSERRLEIGCNSGQLQVSLNSQTVSVPVAIATGSPFTFNVNCSAGSPLSVSVSLNASHVVAASGSVAIATELTLNSVAIATVGKIGFKGCLNNLRLNGYLAPMVNLSLSLESENSSLGGLRWSDSQSGEPLVGCHGDPVCQAAGVCQNSGSCVDLWNAFQCDCRPGFFGANCADRLLPATAGVSTPVIIAICVAALVLVLVVAGFLLFKFVQRRRKETGAYGPSKAETRANSHGQAAAPPVRPPPEERLI